MSKRNLSRRAKAQALTARITPSPSISKSPLPMHRGRRRRQQARRRVAAKRGFVAGEVARIQEEAEKKKGRLRPGLAIMGDLAAALPDFEGGGNEGREGRERGMGYRRRRRLVAEETEQVRRVREHAVFMADPVEALRRHLVNCVGCDAGEVAPALEGRKKRGGGARVGKGGKLAKVDEEMRARVAVRKERKAEMAAAAARKSRGEKAEVEIQRLSGVISQRKSRGRIGVKRPKI